MTRQKTALVTGASSGIGHATVIELANRGYKVFAGARRLEPMKDLEKDHGAIIFSLDVSSPESVIAAKKFLTEETDGYLDILFNNAGQSCTFPAIDCKDEWFKQCYEVNVFGQMRVTRELAPLVINAKGVIAFTGSIAALIPFPFGSIYSSTKAAIHLYASVLNLELKPFGVEVINVVTGGVLTNIADDRGLPDNSLYNIGDIEASVQCRRTMAKDNNPMKAEEYARRVVNDFERRLGAVNVYRGKMASTLPLIVALVPRFFLEWILISKFKLTLVFAAITKKYSKTKIA